MMKPIKKKMTFEEYQKKVLEKQKPKHTLLYYFQWFWHAIGFIGLITSLFLFNNPNYLIIVCLSLICCIIGFIQDYFDHKFMYHNG